MFPFALLPAELRRADSLHLAGLPRFVRPVTAERTAPAAIEHPRVPQLWGLAA